MADLTYKATVDVSSAERSLSNLQKSVGGLNDTFLRLKSTLATISLGAVISQTINMADAISDLSDATEISIENIIGFGRAVALNGGTVDGAQKGIARLVSSIDEAANKFGSSRQAFNDVGVSLDDLRRLGTQDIFKKAVEGLGKIEDVSKRNRIAVELFGKEFRAVNSAGAAAAFAPAAADSLKFASATKSAADASDKLASSIDTFRQQLLVAIKPVNDLINSLDPKKIAAFTQTVIDIAQGLVLLYAATKAASGIRFLIDSFRVLGGTSKATTGLLGEAAVGVRQLKEAFNLKTAAVVSSYTGFGVLGITLKSLAGGFIRLIPLVGALYAGFQILDGAVEMLTGRDLSKWFDDAAAGLENFVSKNLPGVAAALNKLGEALGMAPPPSVQRENEQELARIKARAESAKKAQEDLKRGQEAIQRIANEAAKQRLSNEQYIQDLGIGLSRKTEAIALEARMIELSRLSNSLSEDQVEIIKAQSDANVERLAAIKRLEDQQAKLRLDRSQTQDEDQKKILSNQIAGLTFQIEKTKEYYNTHNDSLEYYITKLQTAKKLDAARLQDMENMKKSIEDQIARQQTLGDTIQKINDQRIDIQFQGSQIGVSGVSRDINQAIKQADDNARDLSRSIAESYSQFGDDLPASAAQELANSLALVAKRAEGVKKQTIDNIVLNYEYQQSVENLTRSLEQQQQTQESLNDTIRKLNDQRIDIKVEREQQGLTQLQRQFAQIEESARKAALEAGRAFAATFDTGGDALTPERAQQLADGLAKIAEGYRAIADQQRANLEASQTFEAGWRTAFESFYENATNAAKIAENSFNSVFGNIFSALDRFVETGKFSFKDFARSIIQDLIKIELKANAMQLFKGLGLSSSAGGATSLLGSLLPSIFGNQFTPGSSSFVGPMQPSAGGGGSFLSSIGSFFGGLFGGANGGPLDTSPLIVGERGPELFIPRSAGQLIANNKLGRASETAQVTYITNNISAIDAKSVAQLFYENRQTLFGTVEQAKKELPFRQGAMA